MALRKHECIELLSQHADKIGFPQMVRLFESASPLDKKECQRQYWNKVNVKTLRQFAESIQNAGSPNLIPSYAVSENDLPETIEEIEYIEENAKEHEEYAEVQIPFLEDNEDNEEVEVSFDWDDEDEDFDFIVDEDEEDLFDLVDDEEDIFEL